MSAVTWEQQMADRARERARERAASEPAPDRGEHEGHHSHFDNGRIYCSCGKYFGLTCYAIPQEWWDNPALAEAEMALEACDVCGKKGVARIGRHPLAGVTWALDE